VLEQKGGEDLPQKKGGGPPLPHIVKLLFKIIFLHFNLNMENY